MQPSNLQKNVLIVDDDELHLFAFGKELEQYGWTVHAARSGSDGIELARIVKPPLIFVDLQMEGLDGFEVCARIRAEAWSAQTVLIAASGLPRRETEERALRSGFDLYLLKPFSDNLVSKILQHTAVAAGLSEHSEPRLAN